MKKEENLVLCGANAYEEKFYLNEQFQKLPQEIKDELQIMCVLYTQDVGGIFLLEFDKKGNLHFRTEAASDDYSYDEIGSVLKLKSSRGRRKIFCGLWRCIINWFSGPMSEKPRGNTHENRNSTAEKSCNTGAYGRSDRPAFSFALQRAWSWSGLYGNGQRQGDFLP